MSFFKWVILVSIVGSSLLVWSCEESDTTPPEVTITSPQDNSTVSEIVTITCISTDNEGIDKVELWVDGISTGLVDKTEPYSIDWNTLHYTEGLHSITILSYDKSNNQTESQPIELMVDNTEFYPSPITLSPITFIDNSFTLLWSHNQDDDFLSYKIYESLLESMESPSEIFSTTNRDDTTFVINSIVGEYFRYYQVCVEDSIGLKTLSNVEKGSSITVFFNVFGGEVNDVGSFVRQTTDNGYIVIGSTNSYGEGNDDILLIKTDRDGELEWERTYGGSNYDRGVCIQQTEDGGYILLGNTNSYGSGNGDVWLIKTNSSGELLWSQTCCSEINWDQSYGGYYVEQTNDQGFIITGHVWNSRMDILVIKTDSNGNREWVKEYGELWKDDEGYSIHQTIENQYLLTGYTESYGNGDTDIYLMKLNSTGDPVWSKTFGGDDHDRGFSSDLTTDGGVIITGYSYSYGEGNYDLWLLKSDSDGNEEWNQTFGWGDGEEGLSVDQTNDGGYIITGNTYYNGGNDIQLWLIKTDPLGSSVWEKGFGGNDPESGQSVQQTQNGGYVVVGSSQSYEGSNYNNIILIKTDSQGNTQ